MGAMTRMFTGLAKRFLPDAYIFALALTLVTFLAAMIFQKASVGELVSYWGEGFWDLMQFAMQMALVLITGFTLAKTELVNQALKALARLAKTNLQAVFIVTAASCAACYLNWGFGLVVSALLAVELAKTVERVNYGLLISSAYSGFLVWHGGLSGSIPLKLTDPQPAIQKMIGVASIGLDQTLYANFNLIILVCTCAAILGLNCWMATSSEGVSNKVYLANLNLVNLDQGQSGEESCEQSATAAQKLENSWVLNLALSFLFAAYLAGHFMAGKGLDLNTVIFIFLGLSIFLHWRPKRFLKAFSESVEGASGILLQFPFYAGIMAVMSGSGLAASLSEFFISISTEKTFYFFTYLSAGVVNFFVPSGGGQWALQGPIALPAAAELGLDFAKTSMAVAWGDAWTNMIQPFWALPLLAAGKCDLKDMMGYSAMVFLAAGAVQSLLFILIA